MCGLSTTFSLLIRYNKGSGIREKLTAARAAAVAARDPGYPKQLVGTLGVDPALVE